jgi:nitroimidazol reductase NimA-like FMN-containing flavoprotein (pyridoxamine 5'-phosphate oxidase superfamily)
VGAVDPDELRALARRIIDSNLYMTLATADGDGLPWASPVYFAPAGYRELLWVSVPDARHSLNIAARPEVGIAIFDSTVQPGEGRAVYVDARAEELTESPDFDRCLAAYNARLDDPSARGARAFEASDVRPPEAHLRLYRATASGLYALDPDGHPDGRAGDYRAPVDL